jgi:hypothetical protein
MRRSGNSDAAWPVSYLRYATGRQPAQRDARLTGHNWRNGRIQGTMVTGTALCDPEGGLLEEAGRLESPATQPAQPERNAQDAQWNLPTWEDIVRAHSARVYRLAYRLTGNPHDAEDLTQEVFVRVFRSLASHLGGQAWYGAQQDSPWASPAALRPGAPQAGEP